MINVEYFEGLTKHFDLIGSEGFFFGSVFLFFPFLGHLFFAFELLIGGDAHNFGGDFPEDLIIDFETVFHFKSYSDFINYYKARMIEEDSKADITFPPQQKEVYLEDQYRQLTVGYCVLAVLLKLLPIVL